MSEVGIAVNVHHEQAVTSLRRAVQDVLMRGLHDPRVRGLISVTRVELSTDYSNATIHISVLPAEQAELALHGIRHATSHIRTEAGKRVTFRRMPTFSFRLDESIKRVAGIDAALRDDENADPPSDAAPQESDTP